MDYLQINTNTSESDHDLSNPNISRESISAQDSSTKMLFNESLDEYMDFNDKGNSAKKVSSP